MKFDKNDFFIGGMCIGMITVNLLWTLVFIIG